MIRSILAAGISAAALALSLPATAQADTPAQPPAPAPAPASADSAKPAATPQMDFGTWGFDPATLDPSVKPGDDFFAYVNGKWVKANPIPPEFTRYGAFTYLDEKSKADVKALIDQLVATKHPAGSSEQRIVDAYFDGSPSKLVAAMLDRDSTRMTDDDLDELARLVSQARRRGSK